jgi:hypothetical protein
MRLSRAHLRPSHPASNVRDDAYAPHEEAGRVGDNHGLLKNGRFLLFAKAEILLDMSGKSSRAMRLCSPNDRREIAEHWVER